MTKPFPSQELLRQILDYDPETGVLTWKRRPVELFNAGKKHSRQHNASSWNTRYAGKPAFASKNGHGYFQGSVFKRKIEAQRVIWAWMTGEWPPTVDHEDGDLENNRWVNLKEKSRSGNQRNIGLRKDNKTGVIGVSEKNGLYRAQIQVDGKGKTLGYSTSLDEAAAMRASASEKHGFHPNHGKRKSTAVRKAEALL